LFIIVVFGLAYLRSSLGPGFAAIRFFLKSTSSSKKNLLPLWISLWKARFGALEKNRTFALKF
jgi:hypothetical protein